MQAAQERQTQMPLHIWRNVMLEDHLPPAMNSRLTPTSMFRLAPVLVLTLTQLACIGFRVRAQNAELGPLAEFEGTLSTGDLSLDAETPLVMLLVREDDALRDEEPKPHVQVTNVLYRPGPYHFYANAGRYSVFAFADLNRNLKADDGEPRAVAAKQLLLREGKLSTSVDLTLSNDPLPAVAWEPQLDETITINDERLRERMGRKGGWAPGEWRRENGDDRLYLMEPFDPNRIPIVFVHGTGGTPDDMKFLIKSVDRTRYQVWLFWYASGMRMNISAQSLKAKLDEYRVLHDFSNVVVVSQCVGGLVARDAVVQLQDRDHRFTVAALVTFSTPWSGHGMAESGTTISPMTVPAWYDMKEGSEFQKKAIATAIPTVPHYLFFSYGKGSDVGHDGTVSLTSELELNMQRRATEIIGFSETHMGVVENPEPLAVFGDVLGRIRDRVAAKGAAGTGSSSR